MDIIQ